MPRRRPHELRAAGPTPRRATPVRRIPHVTALTRAAVRRLEGQDENLWPDAVADAVDTYGRHLRRPKRESATEDLDCPCCSPLDARDTLDLALRRLPPGARTDLGRIVARLDAVYLRRSLPDPRYSGSNTQAAQGWWRHRLQ